MTTTLKTLLIACTIAAVHSPALAQTTAKRVLTLQGALQAIDAAKAEAKKLGAGGAIAVVDDGGNLIALERLDGTFAAGASVSIGKARTAAIFKKPTSFFEDIIRNGRTPMIALPDFTPLQGGVPIIVTGEVVGAVGVSGAMSAKQDEDFAVIAANAVSLASTSTADMTSTADLTHFSADAVNDAFSKGAPLLEVDDFKIHASRREKPGMAEVHTDETDVIYVLEGSATFVTGGEIVDAKETSPHELRGPGIEGGKERTIARGEVIVVPAGVPHWFKAINGKTPFLYYVVKVVN